MVSQKPLLPAGGSTIRQGGDYQYDGYYAHREEPEQVDLAGLGFLTPGMPTIILPEVP